MTKVEAIKEFKEMYTQSEFKRLKREDNDWLTQDWNNWTDILCKEGRITDWQYNNWSNPF